MKIANIQMDVILGNPTKNYHRAMHMIRDAAMDQPDVIVLPELWDVGFFPQDDLEALSDRNCQKVISEIGALAGELGINIVAGSVANLRDGGVYNTACVFDRKGHLVAQYDKTHLFSPMGEDQFFQKGDHVCRFQLDGIDCGLIICYDIRFPELVRKLTVPGLELLFMVSQWPDVRIPHLQVLTAARAIENQMFLSCCNACGTAGKTRYGGHSVIIDPWGQPLAQAGAGEETIIAACDFSVTRSIRSSMHVFADRRPELYEREI